MDPAQALTGADDAANTGEPDQPASNAATRPGLATVMAYPALHRQNPAAAGTDPLRTTSAGGGASISSIRGRHANDMRSLDQGAGLPDVAVAWLISGASASRKRQTCTAHASSSGESRLAVRSPIASCMAPAIL
jgi:hypothetical protein